MYSFILERTTDMLKTMIKVVKEASQIMLDAQNITDNTIKKGDRNFVTLYDTKVQKFIQNTMNKIYPEISFLGEEDASDSDPYNGYCFICDPIDGTANFKRSYKHSAISLALAKDGEIICGVVINPYSKEIFYASKGKGAFLNDTKICVSDACLKDSFVSFGTAPYYPDLINKTMQMITKIMPDCEDIRRTGSAALDLCYLACGRHDMFFELSLFPWDYAAASIIIEEAGGIITDRNGNKPPLHKRTEIYAGNKKVYKEFFDKNYFI